VIEMKRAFSDQWFYVLAALFGMGIGWVDVAADDLPLRRCWWWLAWCLAFCGHVGLGDGP
jgi:hypothetical protein